MANLLGYTQQLLAIFEPERNGTGIREGNLRTICEPKRNCARSQRLYLMTCWAPDRLGTQTQPATGQRESGHPMAAASGRHRVETPPLRYPLRTGLNDRVRSSTIWSCDWSYDWSCDRIMRLTIGHVDW